MLIRYLYFLVTIMRLLLSYLTKFIALDSFYLKILLVIIFAIITKVLITYPRNRFKKLSQFREYKQNAILKYGLYSKYQVIYSCIIVLFGSIILSLGIFLLRKSNEENVLNVKTISKKIYEHYSSNNLISVILDLMLVALLLIIIFLILLKITQYYKFHVIKLHLYLIGYKRYEMFILTYKTSFDPYYAFEEFFVEAYLDKLYFQYRMCRKYKKWKLYPYTFKEFKEGFSGKISNKLRFVLPFIFYKGHYILIVALIFYDLIFNDFEIKLFYTYIPYIFIYDMYIKVVRFFGQLHIPSDNLIGRYLYCEVYLVDKNEAYFGEDLIDLNHFRNIYQYYIKHGFKWDDTNLYKI